MKQDAGLRNTIRKRFKQAHWTSVENPLDPGAPDLHYCFIGGFMGWIECKKAENGRIDLRSDQAAWMTGYALRGGRVFIVARENDKLWILRITSKPDTMMRLSLKHHLDEMDTRSWSGGFRNWDWDAIERLLKS